jgi:hypothetical protein
MELLFDASWKTKARLAEEVAKGVKSAGVKVV